MTKCGYKIREYSNIVFGSFLTSLGISLFNIPAKIVDGGVSGITTMLFYLKGWPVALTNFAISIPLFLLGLFVFGNKYGLKSLTGTILITFFLALVERVYGLKGILDLSKNSNMMLSALFGGTLTGLGMGMVMRGGANTGGTDILGQVLARYTFFTQGSALFLIDGMIILSSAFCFGIEEALYGVLDSFIATAMIDKVLLGFGTNQEKSVFIISLHRKTIEEAIMNELGHGGTILMAQGMYTKSYRPVIMCVISNHELGRLTRIVHDADKRAFMIVQEAYEVLGEGFTPIEEAAWETENDITQETQKPVISPKVSQDNNGSQSSS